jgi:hypothetical protein
MVKFYRWKDHNRNRSMSADRFKRQVSNDACVRWFLVDADGEIRQAIGIHAQNLEAALLVGAFEQVENTNAKPATEGGGA